MIGEWILQPDFEEDAFLWSPPPGVLEFDTNGASKEGKCYLKEKVKFLFAGQIGTTNSDEANVWVI